MIQQTRLLKFPQPGSPRVVFTGDNPWYVAEDVCAALGLPSVKEAVFALDDRHWTVFNLSEPGEQRAHSIVVDATGMHALIHQSGRNDASDFSREADAWILGSVYPAIGWGSGSTEMDEDELIAHLFRSVNRLGKGYDEMLRATKGIALDLPS